MTRWTQIDIAGVAGDDTPEIVLAVASDHGIRIEREEARLMHAAACAGFAAESGQWLDVAPSRDSERRTILLGAPAYETAAEHEWAGLGGSIVEVMTALRLEAARLPRTGMIGEILLGALLHSYRRDIRTAREAPKRPARLLIDPADEPEAAEARRIARAVNRARAWVEAPANELNPVSWAAELPAVFEPLGARLHAIDADGIEALGAEALSAVGRGGEQGPVLAVVEWRGAPERDGWDAALVGKGVTFDTGGLNLKTMPNLGLMRFDMAGGAAVLGAVELAASRKARCNVVAVVPMAENAVDARSYRPGDVIGSIAGLTIEVRNTDFEGRLVLADGIAYALRTYRPRHVVDIATLTGVIAMTLLEEFAAVYSNDDALAAGLDAAGKLTGELVWRMPCQPNQDYVVESAVADVANQSTFVGALGVGTGAPVSGPKLLQRFVGDTAWAHIDIAGTAWAARRSAYSNVGPTGYGARLLDQWLRGMMETTC